MCPGAVAAVYCKTAEAKAEEKDRSRGRAGVIEAQDETSAKAGTTQSEPEAREKGRWKRSKRKQE